MSTYSEEEDDKDEKSFKKACDNFNKAQVSLIKSSLVMLEKIAFYSAGAISLSITFVGYLVNSHSDTLKQTIFFLPAYYLLYSSWFLFGISIIIGFIFRRSNDLYIYYSSRSQYFFHRKKYKEKEILLVDGQNALYALLKSGGKEKDEYKKDLSDSIASDLKIHNKDKEKECFYLNLKVFLLKTGIICFVLAIFLLIFFAISVTSKIIN